MRASIETDEADFFAANGFVRIRDVLDPAELDSLRKGTAETIGAGEPGRRDFWYERGAQGGDILRRIDYILDKVPATRSLMAHPFVLDCVSTLQGEFIPTWDSMVVKMQGEGAVIPWHRDADRTCVGDYPIFNVDIYLDDAGPDTALWAVPGSHLWSDEQAAGEIDQRNAAGFVPGTGAECLTMSAGDVLLHNILLVHGSPPTFGNQLRRVIYLEFRPVATELALGPHVADYVPLKQDVLAAAVAHRESGASGEGVRWRVPHEIYWRDRS